MKHHDTPPPSTSPGYDIIGDIHGEFARLETLLSALGYRADDRIYSHPAGRVAVFVGDLIDRGPDSRSVLHLVRAMSESGHALVTMGNHEYNCVAFHTADGEGGYLRPHTPRNVNGHAATLDSFADHEDELPEFIDWMRSLPFFLELDGLRVVHASWIDGDIDYLRDKSLADDTFLVETSRKGSRAHTAIENILKGVELELPDGVTFFTPDGAERTKLRVRWWEKLNGRPWRKIGFPERPEYPLDLVELKTADDLAAYGDGDDAPPVLFGHYKLTGEVPRIETPKVATLDYGAGHGGPATAYRWNGERELNAAKFFVAEVEVADA